MRIENISDIFEPIDLIRNESSPQELKIEELITRKRKGTGIQMGIMAPRHSTYKLY